MGFIYEQRNRRIVRVNFETGDTQVVFSSWSWFTYGGLNLFRGQDFHLSSFMHNGKVVLVLASKYAVATVENVMENHSLPPPDTNEEEQCHRFACGRPFYRTKSPS